PYANKLDLVCPEFVEGNIQKPFEDFTASASLEVCNDQWVRRVQSRFYQDVVRKSFLNFDPDGLGEEARKSLVLIIEIHQKWVCVMFAQIGYQETCCCGFAAATLRACGKQNGRAHGYPPSSTSSCFS